MIPIGVCALMVPFHRQPINENILEKLNNGFRKWYLLPFSSFFFESIEG